jgi:hypothetical protein
MVPLINIALVNTDSFDTKGATSESHPRSQALAHIDKVALNTKARGFEIRLFLSLARNTKKSPLDPIFKCTQLYHKAFKHFIKV